MALSVSTSTEPKVTLTKQVVSTSLSDPGRPCKLEAVVPLIEIRSHY